MTMGSKYVEDLYEWVRRRTPMSMRSVLRALGLKRLSARWDPRDDPNYVWPLNGPLEGHYMHFGRPEDFQFLDPHYEPAVCAAISRLVQRGWVCADAGAHIGYFTLLMAKLVGSEGRVFAFEALPENAKLLAQNVELNGYQERVTVENRAVSDGSEAVLTLYAGPSSFEATIMSRGWKPLKQIPAVALDGYFPPGRRLDFVKMDIEGGEVKAIPGMLRILAVIRPLMLVEVHDIGWPALDLLQATAYTLYDLGLFPVDVKTARGRINHCIAAPNERLLIASGRL